MDGDSECHAAIDRTESTRWLEREDGIRLKQALAKAGGVIVEEVPVPTNSEDEVLVANAFSVVSTGTETVAVGRTQPKSYLEAVRDPKLLGKALGRLKGAGVRSAMDAVWEARKPQDILGYSSAGVVIRVGRNITDLNPGDRVSCSGAGVANHADVVSVPRNLIGKVPDSVGLDAAAFSTLGAIAIHGIRRAGGQFGETMAIVGTGLIGLIGVQVAKAAGMKVIAVEKDPSRVKLAKTMGADHAMTIETLEQLKDFLAMTDGRGADQVVIFAADSGNDAVKLASRLARDRGRVVVVGMVGMEFERGVLYERELDISMSRSYGPGRYDPVYEESGVDYPIAYVRWTENRNIQAFLHLLETGKVDVSRLIGEVYPLTEAPAAYGRLLSGEGRPISVLFRYSPEDYAKVSSDFTGLKLQVLGATATGGVVRVGLVGAGKFAKDFIIPNLKARREFALHTLISSSPLNAKATGEKHGFSQCGTDIEDILRDKTVNLVVIATPHNLHARQVIDSLKAGKAVFTEKPLCLNINELQEVTAAVKASGLPVYVGFNRRYSPFITKAKELLGEARGPLLIDYRVNAGHIPLSHWLQNPEVGGGRIIGECGHFMDVFGFLIGSEVRSMKVSSVPAGRGAVVSHDNFVASMEWADGSVSSLTYTSLGSSKMSKERIEIFAGSKSIVIDDFQSAEYFGYDEKAIRLPRQDKGHAEEFRQLAQAMSGKESSMISFQDSFRATELSLALDELVRTGPTGTEGNQ